MMTALAATAACEDATTWPDVIALLGVFALGGFLCWLAARYW